MVIIDAFCSYGMLQNKVTLKFAKLAHLKVNHTISYAW